MSYDQATADLLHENARLREALREVLKAGEHDGPCDNDEYGEEACSLHLAAYAARKEKAIAALAAAPKVTVVEPESLKKVRAFMTTSLSAPHIMDTDKARVTYGELREWLAYVDSLRRVALLDDPTTRGEG